MLGQGAWRNVTRTGPCCVPPAFESRSHYLAPSRPPLLPAIPLSLFLPLTTPQDAYLRTHNILGRGHSDLEARYQLGRVLGRGADGVVREAVHLVKETRRACKTIYKGWLRRRSQVEGLRREVHILQVGLEVRGRGEREWRLGRGSCGGSFAAQPHGVPAAGQLC